MARAVYQHDLTDPDYQWLLARFQESHPDYCYLESLSMPLVFMPAARKVEIEAGVKSLMYVPPEEPDVPGGGIPALAKGQQKS